MKLLIFTDHKYLVDLEGDVWSASQAFASVFFRRYLTQFSSVIVVSRTKATNNIPSGASRASSERVTFESPYAWSGGIDLAIRVRQVKREVSNIIDRHSEGAAFLARMPSIIGGVATRQLSGSRHPFGLEIVGDPENVFGWGRPAGPVGLTLRLALGHQLRQAAAQATVVGYVPSVDLREKYAADSAVATADYSSIVLEPEAFAESPKAWSEPPVPARLISVASLAFPYKGISVLLQALVMLRQQGICVTLDILGDGRLRGQLEREASTLGLDDTVVFWGHVSSARDLRQALDSADLFIAPSLTEGLPKALLEAMARGLPCIGTRVGGIPLVLQPSECVEPGSPQDLAECIARTVVSARELSLASARNRLTAQRFSTDYTEYASQPIYATLKSATSSHNGFRQK